MARRRFAAGLRAAFAPAEAPVAVEPETKVVSVGFGSTTYAGALAGLEDRAAGWDLDTVIVEGYERSVWVYRCVELYAGNQSSLPFKIGRNIGEDDEEVLEDHALYRVLNKRANPLETGQAFRHRVSSQLLLSKRGVFIEVTKSRAGTITRLDLLAPNRVLPVPSDNGDYLKHFEYTRRDGQVREIDPERVRWIKMPHPTDIFSSTTPLEAAGLSVDLDKLSREYNVEFIRRDARPGGIVSVDADGMPEGEAERIERRFRPGASEAGYLAVIATGPGGVKYVDTSTRPRDMNYAEASKNARLEVLTSMGVPESLLSSAAERTFDNAEQEEYNFWTTKQKSHNSLICAAFDDDIDDEWDAFLDTSEVGCLEVPRRIAREEARKEFDAGLRSIDEYRPLAGLDPVASAQTRALWVSPQKAPIPTDPGDAAALGMEDPNAPIDAAPDGAGGTAADAVAEAQALGGAGGPAGGSAAEAVQQAMLSAEGGGTPGAAAEAVQEAMGAGQAGGVPGEAAAAVQEALQTKSATTEQAPGQLEYDGGEQEAQRAELAAAAALDALLARQLGVITARLQAPKTRRGTRFWQADGPADTRAGQQPLDSAAVVDPDRWAQETTDTLAPLVTDAGAGAAGGLLGALAGAGAIAGVGEGAAELTREAGRVSAESVMTAVTIAAEAMKGWLARVARRIDVEAEVAPSIDAVIAVVRAEYAEHSRSFAEGVATMVGQTAVVGSRDAAARSLAPMPGTSARIVRTWVSQLDERVRESHREVAGSTLPVGERFEVDGFPLRYPGDPFGPPAVSRNCRCRLTYRVAPGARYLSGAVVAEPTA